MDGKYEVTEGFMIISGGQSGADRAALDWAIAHGVPFGGWCPKDRRCEHGRIPDLYQLTETPSRSYLQRTEWNVRDSDATIVFTLSDVLDGGSLRTANFAKKLGKPWLHVCPETGHKTIIEFLEQHQVHVLNIAGKRESSAPGVVELVKVTLDSVLYV